MVWKHEEACTPLTSVMSSDLLKLNPAAQKREGIGVDGSGEGIGRATSLSKPEEAQVWNLRQVPQHCLCLV